MNIEEMYKELLDKLKNKEEVSNQEILEFIHEKKLRTSSEQVVSVLTYKLPIYEYRNKDGKIAYKVMERAK